MTFDSKTFVLLLGIMAVIVVAGALLIVGGVNGPESVSREGEGVVSQEEAALIPAATGDVGDVVDALLRDAQEEEATVNAQGDDTQFVIGDSQEADELSASYDEASI